MAGDWADTEHLWRVTGLPVDAEGNHVLLVPFDRNPRVVHDTTAPLRLDLEPAELRHILNMVKVRILLEGEGPRVVRSEHRTQLEVVSEGSATLNVETRRPNLLLTGPSRRSGELSVAAADVNTLTVGGAVTVTTPGSCNVVEVLTDAILAVECGLKCTELTLHDGACLSSPTDAKVTYLAATRLRTLLASERHSFGFVTQGARSSHDLGRQVRGDGTPVSWTLETGSLFGDDPPITFSKLPNRLTLDAPTNEIQLEGDEACTDLDIRAESLCATGSLLRSCRIEVSRLEATDAQLVDVSGHVGTFRGTRSRLHARPDFALGRILAVDRCDLAGVDVERLELGDLVTLKDASLFLPRLERFHLWRLRRRGSTEVNDPEREAAFWGTLGRLLETNHGGGRAKSLVRTAAFQWRRRALTPWRSAEWWALSAFALIGYGESIAAPLLWYVAGCLLAALGAQAWASPNHWWSDTLRVFAKLLGQPLRFFSKDEDALKLIHDVPHGWWTSYAPIAMQLLGAVLVLAALNAVRRIVRAI